MNPLKKLLFFFEAAQRKALIGILGCIVLMGIVEMIGIATILPFMAVVANPDVVHTNSYLAQIFGFLSFQDTRMFMLFLGGIVFLALVLGNFFSALTTWIVTRFCYEQGKRISCTLLGKYLSQSYTFFLSRNSSQLGNSMLTEIDRVVVIIFMNSIQALVKLVVMFCIFSLLIIVKPLLALITMGILGSAYCFIYLFMRKKLVQSGQLASQTNIKRYQMVNEVVGAVKELKILGKEQQFLEVFGASAAKYARAETICQFTPLMTRYLIEMIAFGGMIVIALYLIGTQEDLSQFMPLLGLYALAGYRLMPAMQQLFTGFSLLRYHFSILDNLAREMQLQSAEPLVQKGPRLPFERALTLNHVSYHYPQAEKRALNNLSLTIPKDSTVGIVGSSGAGKTTLIDVLLGLLMPTEGKLLVDDSEVTAENIRNWRSNIGYVPQNIFLLDSTIASNIALGVPPDEINQAQLERAARLAHLHDFIMKELPQGYATQIGERGVRLSGGQRQRIGIARALYHDPQLLIFDEATSALDNVTEKIIMEAIHSLAHRKTIILIAHRLNTVKDCDLIYVLNEGEVVGNGSYDELIEGNQIFKQLAQSIAGAT